MISVTLNMIGLVLAATNVWTYPRHYTGAFVLGNLLTAILMRNELFGRLLYLIVNTLFAKVRILFFVVGAVDNRDSFGSGLHYGSVWDALQSCNT